jgi:hypothetical protein
MQTCSHAVTSYAKPARPGDGRAATEVPVIAVARGKREGSQRSASARAGRAVRAHKALEH